MNPLSDVPTQPVATADSHPGPTTGPEALTSGAILFARYAYPPNELGYCGPADHQALLDYGAAGTVDPASSSSPRGFAGAWPYLEFIAGATGIGSPLDRRVVEAYWLGEPTPRPDRHGEVRQRADRSDSAGAPAAAGAISPRRSLPAPSRITRSTSSAIYPWVGLLADRPRRHAARAAREVPDPVGPGRLDRRRPGDRPGRGR